MSEEGAAVGEVHEHQSNAGKWIILLLAVLYVAGSLYAIYDYRGRLEKLEKGQAASSGQLVDLGKRMAEAEASAETMAGQLGMTKKELARRTAELQSQQRAAESRLSRAQKEQISQVTGEVAGVKTEVGGVKTDVASTRSDLEATKARLESVKGDMGVMSGLIATNGKDLAALRELGERNYFEFDLTKKMADKRIGNVTLRLKSADTKRNRYTLEVLADDKRVEKKDKTINEPVQVYVSGYRQPYEIVINQVKKDGVVGYLSTPKVTLARK